MLSADGVSATGGGGSADGVLDTDGGPACLLAMMLYASIRAFFWASRAIFVLSAMALPAATRFGFCFVAGVCEVTC